jgi:hypothetical protein
MGILHDQGLLLGGFPNFNEKWLVVTLNFIFHLENSIGQGNDSMGFGPAPQKDGQEFPVGEGLCTFLPESFPGAVKDWDVEYFFHDAFVKVTRVTPI